MPLSPVFDQCPEYAYASKPQDKAEGIVNWKSPRWLNSEGNEATNDIYNNYNQGKEDYDVVIICMVHNKIIDLHLVFIWFT